jgi:hypothetical protein
MHAPLALTATRTRVVWIAIVALVLGLGLAAGGVGTANASPSAAATAAPDDPFCREGGSAVDISVTLDPVVYGTNVQVMAEVHENNADTGDRFIYVVNAFTDDEGVARMTIWRSDNPRISTGWALYYDDGVDDADPLPDDAVVVQTPHRCGAPETPVCVLATGPGYATVKYGDVTRTWHFSSRVVLPQTCVTAAEAKAWAKRLGVRY